MLRRCVLEFFIGGKPIPKGRPRAVVRGRFATFYTPKATVEYEKVVRKRASTAAKGVITGPISINLNFRFKRPKSKEPSAQHIGRPDLDNLIKSVLDGFIGVVYVDDSQINSITACKAYSAEEGVYVSVFWSEERE